MDGACAHGGHHLGSVKGRVDLTYLPSLLTLVCPPMSDTDVSTESLPITLPGRLFGGVKLILKSVDCHAGGEPARIIFSGVPKFPSSCTTAQSKRSYMMNHMDNFRLIALQEPRGYPCQNVDFVFQPAADSENFQYVIGEQNKIYPLMSGHNTICVATAVVECGLVKMKEPVTKFTLEAPAGPIEIVAKCTGGKARSIVLKNAPSFVEALDVEVEVPHIGTVRVDIAYGGMWYAVVELSQFNGRKDLNMALNPDNGAELCRVGEMIKVACREQRPVQHPTEDYPGVDILVFRGPAIGQAHGRNTVVMSNCNLDWNKPETWTAMLDRSPCGTGTCAVMAVMHARGELAVGQAFVHESIVGSLFTGTILAEVSLPGDGRAAIIPQIEGSACITQYSEIVVDPEDPFPQGYRVADIW